MSAARLSMAAPSVHEPNGDIIVGGLFDTVSGIPAKRVARWDGAAWHALGAGLGEDITISSSATPVRTLHRLSGGDILAGGYFTSAEGDFNYVARWDGAEWGQVRAGTGGVVLATLELSNGDLAVAGEFTRVDGVAANRVARRVNGVWQPLGTGADAAVAAIMELPNGDLIVGGEFTSFLGSMRMANRTSSTRTARLRRQRGLMKLLRGLWRCR